jgi:Phage late-transcription coactivator
MRIAYQPERVNIMSDKDEMVTFSYHVEKLANSKSIPYIGAVILYCEERQLEVEVAAKLISASLKAKIRLEAEELHFLPKSNTARLPF